MHARHLRDLQGGTRLATDATLGLVALVEAMHARIASPPGLRGPASTSGITGLVYKTVRGVTRLAGGSVQALLAALTPLMAADPGQAPARERQAVLAALNGVLGDHLAATHNPLATPMTFQHQGKPLVLQPDALRAALPAATGRVLVLMHGLCMNHLQWQRDGHDHGAALAAAASYTPVYLHYNSGRPIHANGAELAGLMAQLLAAWPQAVTRVAMLCHSMGGLVARSALHQARSESQSWPAQVDDIVFLGTPHQGAPLERVGHGVDLLLGALPYAAPLARLGKLRSAGITDLRFGRLLDEPLSSRPRVVPLPVDSRCYAIAAVTGAEETDLKSRALGDGLVPLASALGLHRDNSRTLGFDPARTARFADMNHLQLLNRPEVAELLLHWLA